MIFLDPSKYVELQKHLNLRRRVWLCRIWWR